MGVDAQSTFCFWLSPEEHRDADTWGVRLLELVDQGFAPKATIADFGSGLRAGHQEVLPEVPGRGDVFHALYHTGPLARYLENRAYEAIDARAKLEGKSLWESLWKVFGVKMSLGSDRFRKVFGVRKSLGSSL